MTASPRPFRFGIIVGRQQAEVSSVLDPATFDDTARRVEDLGFSTILVPDHFSNQYGPFTMLMRAADVTRDLRVGTLVLCNDFRHPAVLAKEAATLDVLSGGRLELGLGAGWQGPDYEITGIRFDRPGVRIDRLEESLQVLRHIFRGEPFGFAGTHYTIDGYEAHPVPAQRPHPPLLLGGGGPRMLRLAAREADIVGIVVNLQHGGPDAGAPDLTSSAVEEKVGWVREEAGDRFDDIELSIFPFLVSGDTGSAAEAAAGIGLREDDVMTSPFVLAGDTSTMVDALVERRERLGISYVTVRLEHLDALAPVVAQLRGT